jgi:hypothetical protein
MMLMYDAFPKVAIIRHNNPVHKPPEAIASELKVTDILRILGS